MAHLQRNMSARSWKGHSVLSALDLFIIQSFPGIN